jgi:hypothetical protein
MKLAKEKDDENHLKDVLQRMMIRRPENETFLTTIFLAIINVPAIQEAIEEEGILTSVRGRT